MALRHFITVIGYLTQKDTTGQDVKRETTIARDVPCSIETVTGGEVRRGQQMQATTTVLLKMHHPQGAFEIQPEHLLREMYGEKVNREINVVAAYDPDGRRRELHIQGRENA